MHSWYACHRENERQQRLDLLAKALKATTDSIPLSSEEIVNLLEQQLKLKGTSKLPVLMIKERIGKPSLFCGRKSQKELLMDWVNMIPKELAKSRALLGRRKCGKTALMQRLF